MEGGFVSKESRTGRGLLRVVESVAEIVDSLCQEINDGLCEWQDLSLFLPSYLAGPRELRMADHYIVWQARRVVHLQGMLEYIML